MVASGALDALAAMLAFAAAVGIHTRLGFLGVRGGDLHFDGSMFLYVGVTLVVFAVMGLWRAEVNVSRAVFVRVLARACAAALVLTVVAAFFFKLSGSQSRMVVAVYFLLVFVLVAVVRLAWFTPVLASWMRASKPVSFAVGASPRMQVLARHLEHLRVYDEVVHTDALALRGALAEARARGCRAPFVFVDGNARHKEAAFAAIDEALAQEATVYVVSDLLRPLTGGGVLVRLFEAPVVRVGRPRRSAGGAAKRAFDAVCASLGLIVLSPFLLALAVAVKLSSPGPAIFAQDRVGLNGRTFRFYKFRSMTADAAERDEHHRSYVGALIRGQEGECNFGDRKKPVFKLRDDGRVTGLGRWLRRTSVDELPQLWNVVKGDMSLVGPRPALDYEVAEYKDWHRRRLTSKPGLTGLWQVGGRSRVAFDEMVFQDAVYKYCWSLTTDVKLCLRTAAVAVAGKGAA